MHLAPGKAVYLTAASHGFTASNFLVLLPRTLFTPGTIGGDGFERFSNTEQQELGRNV